MAVKNVTHKKGVTQIVNISTGPKRQRRRTKRATKGATKGSNPPPPSFPSFPSYQVPALPVWRQGPLVAEVPQSIQQQLVKPIQDKLEDLIRIRSNELKPLEENKYDEKDENRQPENPMSSSSTSGLTWRDKNPNPPFDPIYKQEDAGVVKVKNPASKITSWVTTNSDQYKTMVKNGWLKTDPPPSSVGK